MERPIGEEGEIVVRGHNVMKGYLDRPEVTESALQNGWFHTGDVGRFDSSGKNVLRQNTTVRLHKAVPNADFIVLVEDNKPRVHGIQNLGNPVKVCYVQRDFGH